MPDTTTAGIAAGRLPDDILNTGFADLHAPLGEHEARVAADRCYFCHDAPCVTACPTAIDIPLFIRQIATGTSQAAGYTIFEQNIMGGMCARVCPTEELCEQACVREAAEGKPVEIGRLQRHATDEVMARDVHPFQRAAPTGKRVAVVGAGPAGLAAAHRLAMLGHEVVAFDARAKAGGLNEFGIAAYKSTDDFAAREVEWLLGIGGISVETGTRLGVDVTLDALADKFDAVFLGVGLGAVNSLGLGSAHDAVGFISELRQVSELSSLPIGRDVVVIGGGMTAVDAAVQSKLLGARNVTIAYRRGRENMSASTYEQDLAASKGVTLMFNVQPVSVADGAIELAYTDGSAEVVKLPADQVFSAIGQALETDFGLALEGKKLAVDGVGRTSRKGVWAGGDCASGGDDLTVTAVAEGRDAAMDIHATLMGGN
ncbi:NAD(P)-dependent oxidoreductase [Yoonia sp. MH D7]